MSPFYFPPALSNAKNDRNRETFIILIKYLLCTELWFNAALYLSDELEETRVCGGEGEKWWRGNKVR